MSTKPIAALVGILAVVATLTAVHAVPAAGGSQVAGVRPGGSVPLALLILGPRQNSVG